MDGDEATSPESPALSREAFAQPVATWNSELPSTAQASPTSVALSTTGKGFGVPQKREGEHATAPAAQPSVLPGPRPQPPKQPTPRDGSRFSVGQRVRFSDPEWAQVAGDGVIISRAQGRRHDVLGGTWWHVSFLHSPLLVCENRIDVI